MDRLKNGQRSRGCQKEVRRSELHEDLLSKPTLRSVLHVSRSDGHIEIELMQNICKSIREEISPSLFFKKDTVRALQIGW